MTDGHAKLQGRLLNPTDSNVEDFCALITVLPVKLGRSTQGEGAAKINLGENKATSRHHATLDYSAADGSFFIECLGKNGMVVDHVHYGVNQRAALKAGTAVKIGSMHAYFLPALKKPSHTYKLLVEKAFAASPSVCMGIEEITAAIQRQFPYYSAPEASKNMHTLIRRALDQMNAVNVAGGTKWSMPDVHA